MRFFFLLKLAPGDEDMIRCCSRRPQCFVFVFGSPCDKLDVLSLRHGSDAVNHGVGEGGVRLHPLPQLGAHIPRHLQHHVLDLRECGGSQTRMADDRQQRRSRNKRKGEGGVTQQRREEPVAQPSGNNKKDENDHLAKPRLLPTAENHARMCARVIISLSSRCSITFWYTQNWLARGHEASVRLSAHVQERNQIKSHPVSRKHHTSTADRTPDLDSHP